MDWSLFRLQWKQLITQACVDEPHDYSQVGGMLTKSMTAHREVIAENQKLRSVARVLRKLSHRIKMSSLSCYFLVKLSVILSFRWNVKYCPDPYQISFGLFSASNLDQVENIG